MSVLYPDLANTNFPNSLDSFIQFLDITASDGPLVLQYITAMNQGNLSQAAQILSQIPSASQKVLKATDLNKITQAILAIERFYNSDIHPYVDELQQSWTNTINQFQYKGVWNTGTTYQRNNYVQYITNGVNLVYIAIADPPAGTVPTNTTYWRVLTIQGQQGLSGDGVAYRQAWKNDVQYQSNQIVTYDGALWLSLQPNQNVEPGTNSSFWREIVSVQALPYPVQSEQPLNQDIGSLWFNTQNNPTNYYPLQSLSRPAGANQIASGYQAYNAQGQMIVGVGNIS